MNQYLPLITGSGGALIILAIICWAFATGKIHSDAEYQKQEAEIGALRAENTQYRLALDTERHTTNETASAGLVTNQLITALTNLAADRKAAPPSTPSAGLTAKDLGL